MDYKVVVVREVHQSDAKMKLEKEVKALLKDGWKLYGGVSVSIVQVGFGDEILLAQAMTK